VVSWVLASSHNGHAYLEHTAVGQHELVFLALEIFLENLDLFGHLLVHLIDLVGQLSNIPNHVGQDTGLVLVPKSEMFIDGSQLALGNLQVGLAGLFGLFQLRTSLLDTRNFKVRCDTRGVSGGIVLIDFLDVLVDLGELRHCSGNPHIKLLELCGKVVEVGGHIGQLASRSRLFILSPVSRSWTTE
jgi:hypothetical protein